MAFSESLKEKVKQKAFFRCVICHQPFVEVHHIIPQRENGPDTEDNAAPLCSGCHDLYGDNPSKRKQIKQMRDHWYKEIEDRRRDANRFFEKIEVLNAEERMRTRKGVALYHVVFENENFETSAQMLFDLIRQAQNKNPDVPRYLYLDIEGHRNKEGGFDKDMFELQTHFILGFLMKYISEVYLPLGSVINKAPQENDVPDMLKITG